MIHKCCDVVDDELSNLSLLLIFQRGWLVVSEFLCENSIYKLNAR